MPTAVFKTLVTLYMLTFQNAGWFIRTTFMDRYTPYITTLSAQILTNLDFLTPIVQATWV